MTKVANAHSPSARAGRLRLSQPVRAAKRQVAAAARASYPTAKAVGHLRLARALRRPRPVLVYQMGKVGSQAVARSLEAAGVAGAEALHLHSLDPVRLAERESLYRREWSTARGGSHVWAGQAVRRALAHQPDRRWDVVTLVRDPVARNLSAFFQVGAVEFGLDLDGGRGDRPLDDATVAHLTATFLERFREHDLPLRWFDDELAAHFGVDVFATPFPTERGYAVYEGDRARVLLIRLEDLRRVAADAFRDFLGIPALALEEVNVGAAKGYAAAYAQLTQEVRLPEAYLDRLYGSRCARHLYRQDELDGFRARWTHADGRPAATASA